MATAQISATESSAIGAAEARYAAAKRRAMLRRRILPILGLAALIGGWALLVYGLDVKPFIAPSPLVVAQTLVAKFGLLMSNLVPTATEALVGFLLGNLVAIIGATLFVHFKSLEEMFFPIVVLINTIPSSPRRRSSCCCSATAWSRRSRSPR